MNAEERLFTSGDMLGTLRAQQASARQAVYDWNADQLLATAEADVIEYVVQDQPQRAGRQLVGQLVEVVDLFG